MSLAIRPALRTNPESALAAIGLAVVTVSAAPLAAQTCQTQRVSVTSTGAQTADTEVSRNGSLSGDGRYVLFESGANHIVPGDVDGRFDVFRRDRLTNTVRRVSLAHDGSPPNAACFAMGLSGDGRTALFLSDASNLVPGDTNGWADLFAVEIASGTISRVNVNSQGAQSVGGPPLHGTLSRDGRCVAFATGAADLVPGDTNGVLDVFVRDLDSGTTTRVSVDSNGVQGDADSGLLPLSDYDSPHMSADGRFVVFGSVASNLVVGDTNGSASTSSDVFVHDTQTGVTERISVATGGNELLESSCGDAVISADGQRVAFVCRTSSPNSLLPGGVYLRDRTTGITSLVAPSPSASMTSTTSSLWMTPDGNALAFTSNQQNLLPGVSSTFMQAYVANLSAGSLRLVSIDQQGHAPLAAASEANGISDDGSTVLFVSYSSNLVPNDTNGAGDLFVRACPSESGTTFCIGTATACPCGMGGLGIGGCENSQSTGGATLRATGLASLTNDTLSLIVTDTTASTTALFFQGNALAGGGLGAPFHNGLLCATGGVRRLGQRATTNGTAWYGELGQDVPISLQGMVPVLGGTRHYQVIYRDAAATCSGTSNGSNGVSLSWAP